MNNTNLNIIKWTNISPPRPGPGSYLYTAEGDFEWAGPGWFRIEFGTTIGKPYRLKFLPKGASEWQFAGCFKTVSGAKRCAQRFGTWRN